MPLVIEIRCRWNDPASRKRKTKTFERKRSALLSTAARQSELTNNYSSRKDASPPTASFPSTLGVTIPRKGSRFSTLLFSLPRAVLTRCTGISSIGGSRVAHEDEDVSDYRANVILVSMHLISMMREDDLENQ